MLRGRSLLVLAFAIPILLTSLVGVGGYAAFTKARIDPVSTADAIIVLGGEHDGREAYGIALAERGVADTVVLSDPYADTDTVMQKACAASTDRVEVLCVPPVPSTTRGEAIFTEQLARERGWNHVVVVSWRYHLPRARYIFGRCFSGTVDMQAVPRSYGFSLVEWEFTYLYQLAGFVKAHVQGTCEDELR